MRKIAVIVGSRSDFPKISAGINILRIAEAQGIIDLFPVEVCSAHRNPEKLRELMKKYTILGVDAVIACAGKLAALFGNIDSELRNVLKNNHTRVVAVPLKGSTEEATMAALYGATEVPNSQFIFKPEFFNNPKTAFKFAIEGELPKLILEDQKEAESFSVGEVYDLTRVKHHNMVAYAHVIGLLEMCGLIHLSTGKTRETFANPKFPEFLYILATDRISIFDIVLKALILHKGAVLTAMTVYWLKEVFKNIPNHLVAYGRDILEYLPCDNIKDLMGADGLIYLMKHMLVVKKAEVFKVEAIVRGYLTGSGLKDYNSCGVVCGISLPKGLIDGSKLPETIFTPSTKADYGEHDENIDFEKAARMIGYEKASYVRDKSLEIFAIAGQRALDADIIIADTKFEFGEDADGNIILLDEVLTPDSSRFWPQDGRLKAMEKGLNPPSMDKQPVRNAGEKAGVKTNHSWVPSVELCAQTTSNYLKIQHLLTKRSLEDFWIDELGI
jgi:phosphoribosylaminoimidazole-succinocarboxamide synthase